MGLLSQRASSIGMARGEKVLVLPRQVEEVEAGSSSEREVLSEACVVSMCHLVQELGLPVLLGLGALPAAGQFSARMSTGD